MVSVPAIEMTTMKGDLDVNAYMEEFGLTLVAQMHVMTVMERPATRVNVHVLIGKKEMEKAVHAAWKNVVIEQNVMKIVSFFSLN